MIRLDEEQLRIVQKIELEILLEIDRICRKNRIHYSLTGGTLLGAVRHGGFIPWDDDADISMLRSEYTRFRDACKRDLDNERFYFQDIETTEGYRWGYGKLRRKDSLFLRENQEHMPYEQGLFVDIFPRDGIPDGRITANIHRFVCFVLRKFLWSEVGKKTSDNDCIRRVYSLMSEIPLKTLKRVYLGLVRWSNRNRTLKVRALMFPLPEGVSGYEREWYGKYRNIGFEGHKLMVEASYEKWLMREFGDYMELPPEEKRKTHPVSDIRFPKEYLN